MCGIFGYISRPKRFSKELIKNALESISHRGPDDSNHEIFTVEDKWEVCFGHRRLSIIDLSNLANQPMISEDKNYSIVFNGEIYNYKNLKENDLNTKRFKTQSDTEVLLNGLIEFDTSFIEKLNGMFSFCFFDKQHRKMTFARDRVGKKPLYIYQSKDCVIFASEIKPIIQLGVELTLNEEALYYYRWLGYIPAHLTIYNQIKKLNDQMYKLH